MSTPDVLFRPADVFRVPAFLDRPTCRRIRQAMDTGAEEAADVLDGGFQAQVDIRRASNIEVDAPILEDVEGRLDATRDIIAGFFGLSLSEREGPGLLRYRDGGFYRPHRDRGVAAGWPGAARRQVAVVVFLNSSRAADDRGEFTGGALRLYFDDDTADVHPAEGLLIAFPADLLHEVLVVGAGTRDTIVDWFY